MREAPLLTGDIGPIPPEGALLPETYVYSRGDTRESVIERMEAGDAGGARRRLGASAAAICRSPAPRRR